MPVLRALFVGFALTALIGLGTASAQSYGLGDQVLTLPPAAFRDSNSSAHSFLNLFIDAYLYPSLTDGTADLMAPLTLPNGAEIFQMCLYSNLPGSGSASAGISVSKLVPGGESPFVSIVPGSVLFDSTATGYRVLCTDPFSYVFHDSADVDGVPGGDLIAHYVRATLSGASAGFGGVRIAWRRQVSPPPGSPTFGDVPPLDPAFSFIEALVASGVTVGCGGGNYCPDSPITRRQMAVFLAKALGLHWPF